MSNTKTTNKALSERNRLIVENMKLAYYLANRYRNFSIDHEELRSEALLALCMAADSYKSNRKASFATWATRYISTYLNRFVRRERQWCDATTDIDSLETPCLSPVASGDSLPFVGP